jgi:SAM-dependent methyltransferase
MDVIESSHLVADQALDHWYYRAKFELLLARVRPTGALAPGSRVADVGCGLGLFLTFLEKTGHAAPEHLLGIDPAYPAPATASGGHARIEPHWPHHAEVDLALLMDVLEHTPDDRAVLGEAAGHVAPGGHVFITVPAFNWLFSAHDRFLGHYRRYSLNSLRETIEAVPDLEIVDLHYYYASILPAVVPWRLAHRKATHPKSDLRQLPGWLNRLLRWFTRAELALSAHNRYAGLSVVALCRKRPTAAPTRQMAA